MLASREGPSRFHRLGIVLDGARGYSAPPSAVWPLTPDVVSVDPWPGGTQVENLLGWLERVFPQRPLLGITARSLPDSQGAPIRGLSCLGSGVALVSIRGLCDKTLGGVVVHEVAHALGMEHCGRWDCALSERHHPLAPETRPESLCPQCRTLWETRCAGGAP